MVQIKQGDRSPANINTIPLMLGGNVFGWTADRRASFAVLDCFAEAGGALIDTADFYSKWVPGNEGGESETLLGNWMKTSRRRDQMVIATKVGMLDGEGGSGLQPERIIRAAEESLKRLQTDVIDIYFAHIDDPATPFEQSLGAFQRLIDDGKIRAIGASNFTAERMQQALDVAKSCGLPRFQYIEPKYNLVVRDVYEGALQKLALAEDIAVTPFYGLGGGYLTGKYRNLDAILGSPREFWLRPYLEGSGPQVLAIMDEIASETGAALSDIALAWVRRQPGVLAPIASATDQKQMEALVAGLDFTLDDDQALRLDLAIMPSPLDKSQS